MDVFEVARDRLRRAFHEYDQVLVSYSGGKDSNYVLELTMEGTQDGSLSLADQERLLRMCETARRALGAWDASD